MMVMKVGKGVAPRLGDLFREIYEPGEDGLPRFKGFVGGAWRFMQGDFHSLNSPVDGMPVARISMANANDAAEALRHARKGFASMREMLLAERIEVMERAARILEEHREEFIATLVLEVGKPVKDAEGEVNATIERLKFCRSEAKELEGDFISGDADKHTKGKFAVVLREPIGVVLVITPFNYPLFIPANKIIPALLAGNAVVAKPASDTPLSVLLFARVLEDAGLPPGALNVLVGNGASVGDALVTSGEVNMISFTGSSATGKRIASIAGMKKLQLEMGGKTPAIVLDDADLDLAAEKCVAGALKNAGQRCDGISRILVQTEVANAFRAKLLEKLEKWKPGDPFDRDTAIGPLANERAREKVARLVQDARAKGAEMVVEGICEGLYCGPAVLDKVPLDAAIAWEETFGPVITLMRVKDLDEAIGIANSSIYGLDAAVFTRSMDKAWKAAKDLEDGEVTINDFPAHGLGHFPYGGVKESGIGREGLGYTIREMTAEKTIVFNLSQGIGDVRHAAQRNVAASSILLEENKALARRFYEEVLNRRNLSMAAEIMAEDYVDHGAPPGLPSGREGFKQFFAMVGNIFPDVQVTVEDMIAEEDKVVTRLSIRGTQKGAFRGFPGTGKRATWTGIDIIRISNGKLAERWSERDFLSMLQQVGLVSPPAAVSKS